MPTPRTSTKPRRSAVTAAAKPAARKQASAARSAAKAPAKRATRAPRPLASPSAADAASLRELAKRLGKLELAGLAGKLVQGWRDDLAAIVEASNKSYTGLQAIVSRQVAQIKEAVGEIRSVGKVMGAIGAKESARHLDDLALAGLELALTDIRELAALAANSQRQAFEIVQARVAKNVDEVQQLLRK